MADKDNQKDEAEKPAEGGAAKAGSDKPSASGSRQKGAVPGVRRPAHTIDLKAEEVKEEKASTGPGGEAKQDRKQEAKPSGAAKSASKTGAAKDAAADDGKGAKPDAAGAKSSGPAAATQGAPWQRATPAQLAGFVTHLAAGLVGGVVGVVGASYILPHAGRVSQEFRQDVDSRIAGLESRLGTAESRSAAAASAQELQQRAAALEQRLSGLERQQETLKQAAPAMGGRLDRLEATLKAMEETAAQGGDVAQTAAVRAQVEGMTVDIQSRLSALRADFDSLSARVAALPQDAAGGRGAAAEQASRIDALRQELDALRAETRRTSEAGGGAAALAIQFTALERAAEEGQPFAARLDALRGAAPQGVDLSALDAWAAEGVPPRAELQRRFAGVKKAALHAAPRPDGGASLIDRFMESASSVVRIHRLDGGGEAGPGAALAKMEEHVRTGDLKAATAAADALPQPSREAIAPWLEQARARLALDAALADISDALARRLAGGGQSQ